MNRQVYATHGSSLLTVFLLADHHNLERRIGTHGSKSVMRACIVVTCQFYIQVGKREGKRKVSHVPEVIHVH